MELIPNEVLLFGDKTCISCKHFSDMPVTIEGWCYNTEYTPELVRTNDWCSDWEDDNELE